VLDFSKVSDSYKIVITMLFAILVIQFGTLLYLWKFENTITIERERKNLQDTVNQEAKNLEEYFSSLQKEIYFLSRLEIMDDMIVKDVDKRLATLLQKKTDDLGQGIILQARHKDDTGLSSISLYNNKYFLTLHAPIYVSFDSSKYIGELYLLYPVENFKNLHMPNHYQHLWIEAKFLKNNPTTINNKTYINVSKKLNEPLRGMTLHLSYEKEYALYSLKKIANMLFLAFSISGILLFIVVWILSKKQIHLLRESREILALKRTFLSTMSHELRTPLGSILNLTQNMMVNTEVSDRHIDMLGRIENASEHLLAMINNLLQLSKLESKSMQINKETLDIKELIQEMLEMVEPLIEEKGLVLISDFPSHLIPITTDRNLFQQVVMNLLSNAIKYTAKGTINVRLKEEKGNIMVFTIKDTGMGIDKKHLDLLFTEFYQAHEDNKDIKHSSGLGLALSKKVAKLLKGDIHIKSEGKEKGVVAHFTFTSL